MTATIIDAGALRKGLPQSRSTCPKTAAAEISLLRGGSDVPLELLVAVDISGSMGPSMPKMKKAVKDFLRRCRPAPGDAARIQRQYLPLTRRTTIPRSACGRSIASRRGAPPRSMTRIRGADTLGPPGRTQSAGVFSDGEDEGSHVTLGDVEQRLEASDVTLYMIGQGRGITLER